MNKKLTDKLRSLVSCEAEGRFLLQQIAVNYTTK